MGGRERERKLSRVDANTTFFGQNLRLEDVCLEEAKFGDFKRARSKGTLTMGTFNRKIAICTQAVPHTFSEDGSLRYGDAVVIAHKQTCGSVACDPFTTAGFEGDEYAVSVCEASHCMARNTFIIQRADGVLFRDGESTA